MIRKKLGFLGPGGTFSEEAAMIYCRKRDMELIEYPTIPSVIKAVVDSEVEESIVPLDNNLEGGIAATLDHLVRLSEIYISHEIICPIRQCLMAVEKIKFEDILQVISHPHALGQCAGFLENKFKHAELIPVESTAAAARLVSCFQDAAAIAPKRAADLFNLCILKEGIQDVVENQTRFIVLSHADHPPTGNDKTSLVMTIPDGAGSLYKILGFFAERNINLTRIESRPSRQIIGDWLFFIDCEGHRNEPGREELWKSIEGAVPFLKLLGSYPVHR
ncbi:MAG: prephenate dehydratase [Bacillota bacterium]|nr:prephenate dehydratase [Bacillota bacterium]